MSERVTKAIAELYADEPMAVDGHIVQSLALDLLDARERIAALEREEARAVAPAWCNRGGWLELKVGNATIGTITTFVEGTDWAWRTVGQPQDHRVPSRDTAARAVCTALGLPFITAGLTGEERDDG